MYFNNRKEKTIICSYNHKWLHINYKDKGVSLQHLHLIKLPTRCYSWTLLNTLRYMIIDNNNSYACNHAHKSTSIMSPSLATLVTCELCRPSVQELRFSSFFLRAAHGRCWRKYLLVQFLSVWAFSTSSLCWMRKYLSDSVSAALYELFPHVTDLRVSGKRDSMLRLFLSSRMSQSR